MAVFSVVMGDIYNKSHGRVWRCSVTANKTFDEIGFSDKRRKEKPNMSWFLLKQFAEERGELSPDDDISKNVSNLRKTIKSIFPHIPGDPIKHNQERRAYITSFATSSRIFRE